MVRARGVQVSSAAAPTVLGTAVVRAALLGLLHQSHPGLQKAQSPPSGPAPALGVSGEPMALGSGFHRIPQIQGGGKKYRR